MSKEFYSKTYVCRLLKVGDKKLFQAIEEGRAPKWDDITVGKRVLFKRSVVDTFMKLRNEGASYEEAAKVANAIYGKSSSTKAKVKAKQQVLVQPIDAPNRLGHPYGYPMCERDLKQLALAQEELTELTKYTFKETLRETVGRIVLRGVAHAYNSGKNADFPGWKAREILPKGYDVTRLSGSNYRVLKNFYCAWERDGFTKFQTELPPNFWMHPATFAGLDKIDLDLQDEVLYNDLKLWAIYKPPRPPAKGKFPKKPGAYKPTPITLNISSKVARALKDLQETRLTILDLNSADSNEWEEKEHPMKEWVEHAIMDIENFIHHNKPKK